MCPCLLPYWFVYKDTGFCVCMCVKEREKTDKVRAWEDKREIEREKKEGQSVKEIE